MYRPTERSHIHTYMYTYILLPSTYQMSAPTYTYIYLHTYQMSAPMPSPAYIPMYRPTERSPYTYITCIPTYFYLPNERSHIYLPTCIPTYLPNERSHAFSRLHRYLCTYILTNQLSAPTYLHVGVLLKNLHVFFHHNFKKKLHVFLDGLSTVPCCGCVGQKFTCLFSIQFFKNVRITLHIFPLYFMRGFLIYTNIAIVYVHTIIKHS